VRAIAIVLAITGALAVSGTAAPAPAQAGRCDPYSGPYPGYTGPYAYAAYYYGYPRIAEALVSTFLSTFRITAIGTADPDILIIGITVGIVIK
jgi:hypothetical protein